MSNVVNLNKWRKAKARDAAGKHAAANRVRYGRTKAEKQRDTEIAAEAKRQLDLLKREEPGQD